MISQLLFAGRYEAGPHTVPCARVSIHQLVAALLPAPPRLAPHPPGLELQTKVERSEAKISQSQTLTHGK